MTLKNFFTKKSKIINTDTSNYRRRNIFYSTGKNIRNTREYINCRFTTYRHRFARAAPAPRAKRNDGRWKKEALRSESERIFYWSRENAHVISDHGHEAPRVREISAPTSTRETNNDSRHWSEIVGDNFLKRVRCSNVAQCSFGRLIHIFCLVSHRRWFTIHLHSDNPFAPILSALDG